LSFFHVIGLPVRDVHFTESGGASSILVISMTKEYPEQVKEVAWGVWSLTRTRSAANT